MRVAGRVDDRLLPAGRRAAIHAHLARLLLVELVGGARRGEELRRAVAVDVADLDLVHEGVGRAIDLLDAPALVRMHDRDHALIVGGDHQLGLAVAVDVAVLDVAQAVELAAERRVPVRFRRPRAVGESPGAEQGLVAADGEDAVAPGQRLVEHVAVRVLEHHGRPAWHRLAHDHELRRARHRRLLAVRPGTIDELRLRDQERRVRTAGERVAPRRARPGRAGRRAAPSSREGPAPYRCPAGGRHRRRRPPGRERREATRVPSSHRAWPRGGCQRTAAIASWRRQRRGAIHRLGAEHLVVVRADERVELRADGDGGGVVGRHERVQRRLVAEAPDAGDDA